LGRDAINSSNDHVPEQINSTVSAVFEDFASRRDLREHWNVYTVGSGALERAGDALRLANTDTTRHQVTNAQIDDYQGLSRRRFLWRPPLTMSVRARFSHPATPGRDLGALSGTAGFGFWNDPFLMTGRRWPALPRAIWFFYASPPSQLALDTRTPGCGWKAAALDAARWSFYLLAPAAPLAVPLMNVRALYRALWPIGQRAVGVCEGLIAADMTAWHTYVLQWGVGCARFTVDGEAVLSCDTSPRGPLGFVMWLDNQYMVVTPWGRFRYGLLDAPGNQWMEVDTLSIEMQGE
jgi:hypothetical protein